MLAILDRPPQRLLEAEALSGRVIQRRAVQGHSVPTEFLGAEQRHIGGAQQPFGIRRVVGVHARADACASGEHATIDTQRLLQGGDDLRRVFRDLSV